MKSTFNLLVLLLGFLLANVATAQSPRDQLKQMVEQLQQSPNNTLREKIIKLASTLKPAPAVPDAAVSFEGRAQFAFNNAKSEEDFLAAAREYEKAVAVAPWVAGYYADLCTIYEKAGKLDDAKRHCGFYMIGLTDHAQMTAVKRRIAGLEFGIEKANSPEARVAREKEATQRFIASLEGAKYVCSEKRDWRSASRVEIYIEKGNIYGSNITTWLDPNEPQASNDYVGFKGLWFEEIPVQGRVNIKRTKYEEMRVEIYDDRLVYVHQITFSGHNEPTVYPAETCYRTQ